MESISLFRAFGWDFFRFTESPHREFATVAPRIYEDGPGIQFNPHVADLDDLEDPLICKFWIPMVLNHLCSLVLHEAICDEERMVGDLTGPGWQRFRDVVCEHLAMDWAEVVAAADREGEEYVAESMALGMFAESGMERFLIDVCKGRPPLRLA